jgi:hypothetical protein
MFNDFDFTDFWYDADYSVENYQDQAPDDELVASMEAELGYRLPASYVAFARLHNGGVVDRDYFPLELGDDQIEGVWIRGFYSLGRTKPNSLGGGFGSTFMIEEWGYPAIGIGIADTPSGGHELVMLDYRECGPQGEPKVVHVDQEGDYRITEIAPDFESFVRGLVSSEDYFADEVDDGYEGVLDACRSGSLSPILVRALATLGDEAGAAEAGLRALGVAITTDKGHFSIHADERSGELMDALFWLYTRLATPASFEAYYSAETSTYDPPNFEQMIVFPLLDDPFELCTGGIAPDFVSDWWDARVADGSIVGDSTGYRLSDAVAQRIRAQLVKG